MKKLAYLMLVFTSTWGFSQDLEEQDESAIAERNKTVLNIDVKEPFLQVKPGSCANFKEVSLESGITSYKDLLTKYMYAYLNSEYYTLSGDFTFTLTIDKTGKVTEIQGSPSVRNSDVFFDDMKYIIRRMKDTWNPAQCNGIPVDSKLKINMSFVSMNTEA